VSDPILFYDSDCRNIVYSNGQLVCADTGEVVADHPIVLDAYHNLSDWEASKLAHIDHVREKLAEAVKLYREGVPIREIMRRLGISSYSLLYSVLRASGEMRRRHRPHRRVDPRTIAIVCRYRAEGRTLTWIASQLDRPVATVWRIVKEHCPEADQLAKSVNQRRKRSEQNREEAILLRVLRGELSTWDAAKILGVSPKTVYNRLRKLRQRLGL